MALPEQDIAGVPSNDEDDIRIMHWGTEDGEEHSGVANLTKLDEWFVNSGRGKVPEDEMSLEDIAEYFKLPKLTYFIDY